MTRWLPEKASTSPVRIAPPESARKADVIAASVAAGCSGVAARRRSLAAIVGAESDDMWKGGRGRIR
jgi:hypothetical protein